MGRKITFVIVSCPGNFYRPGAQFGRADISDMCMNEGIPIGTMIRDQRTDQFYVVKQGKKHRYIQEADQWGEPLNKGRILTPDEPSRGSWSSFKPITGD